MWRYLAVNEPPSRSQIRTLARLLLAVVLIQLAYWIVFVPNFVSFRAADRPEFIEMERIEQAVLASPDQAGLSAAQFEAYDPQSRLFARGYYATRVSFTLQDIPEEGLGLLDLAAGDHIRFYINGALLSARGDATLPDPTYHGLQKRIVPISAGLLNVGQNRIAVVSTIDVPRRATIDPPLLADYETVEAAYGWTDFLYNDWRNVTVVIGFVIALMAGAVALRTSDRAVPAWLFFLALSWALHSLFYRWESFPLSGNERVFCYAVVFLFMSASWPAFVDAWTERPVRHFRTAMMVIFGVCAVVISYWLLVQRDDMAFSGVEDLLDQVGILFVLATIGRVIWHFVRTPGEDRILEGAALITLASLIGVFLYNTWVNERWVGHVSAAQPLLLLAIATGFFARKFHLFRSSNEINLLLQARLDQREAELAQAHVREKLWVREQAFAEERQRIMRDMHDGLGSQLMGMLLAARRGKADPERVADGLQQVIDDLRLVIDSMDSVGESFDAAMEGFQRSLAPRIRDAGFACQWDNQLGDASPSSPPRTTLQLFRIIQEAVTNALKHSGGQQITITLDRLTENGDWLRIVIADDGKGMAGPRPGGHGLGNMNARALKEGGSVTVGPGPAGAGVVVRVLLPFPDAVDDRPSAQPRHRAD